MLKLNYNEVLYVHCFDACSLEQQREELIEEIHAAVCGSEHN